MAKHRRGRRNKQARVQARINGWTSPAENAEAAVKPTYYQWDTQTASRRLDHRYAGILEGKAPSYMQRIESQLPPSLRGIAAPTFVAEAALGLKANLEAAKAVRLGSPAEETSGDGQLTPSGSTISTSKRSVDRPLEDIKRWCSRYLKSKIGPLEKERARAVPVTNLEPSSCESGLDNICDKSPLPEPKEETSMLDIYAWLDFIGQLEGLSNPQPESSHPICLEVSSWDADLQVPGPDLLQAACWNLGEGKADRVDKWIDRHVSLDAAEISDTWESWLSGKSRPSGMHSNTVVIPPDALFESAEPDFGEIYWEDEEEQIGSTVRELRDMECPAINRLMTSELACTVVNIKLRAKKEKIRRGRNIYRS